MTAATQEGLQMRHRVSVNDVTELRRKIAYHHSLLRHTREHKSKKKIEKTSTQ